MDKRLTILTHWLTSELDLSVLSIEPASADASFRRYFRARISESSANAHGLPTTLIVMDSPPDKEDNVLFIACAQLLHQCDLNVPIIFNHELSLGFILLSDLGIEMYQQSLNSESANSLYQAAMQSLLRLQKQSSKQSASAAFIEKYSAEKLREELLLFDDWYIQKYHQSQLNDKQQVTFLETMKLLVDSAIEQPQVLVHRDFHCRNLLVTEQNNPGIIDFQDMVIGPISYDLVSLFKDCYIQWSTKDVQRWAMEFHRLSREQGIHQHTDQDQWLKWFDWMGVQRHLKVLGIFSRLCFRDGKDQYLKDIPLTYQYLIDTCSRYPELEGLKQILQQFPHNNQFP